MHAVMFAYLLLSVVPCCSTCTGRRASKIISTITSCFSGNYVRLWPQFFPDTPLRYTPVFDGRAVSYPSLKVLKDYLAWRQADTHINNQVNDRLSRVLPKKSCISA
jgi:tRNA(His) 5'-end guanylyltransferase